MMQAASWFEDKWIEHEVMLVWSDVINMGKLLHKIKILIHFYVSLRHFEMILPSRLSGTDVANKRIMEKMSREKVREENDGSKLTIHVLYMIWAYYKKSQHKILQYKFQ